MKELMDALEDIKKMAKKSMAMKMRNTHDDIDNESDEQEEIKKQTKDERKNNAMSAHNPLEELEEMINADGNEDTMEEYNDDDECVDDYDSIPSDVSYKKIPKKESITVLTVEKTPRKRKKIIK
jgi:hypothetical protein